MRGTSRAYISSTLISHYRIIALASFFVRNCSVVNVSFRQEIRMQIADFGFPCFQWHCTTPHDASVYPPPSPSLIFTLLSPLLALQNRRSQTLVSAPRTAGTTCAIVSWAPGPTWPRMSCPGVSQALLTTGDWPMYGARGLSFSPC